MENWEDLPIRDRAAYMRAAVSNGYRDIRSIKEAYAKFAEGGELYDAGTLPEIEISQKNDPYYKLLVESGASGDIKNSLADYYDNSLTKKEAFNRLLEVYETAGKPNIFNQVFPYYHKNTNKKRAFIDPFLKNVFVTTKDDLISELAHPIQYKYGNIDLYKEQMKAFPFYSGDSDPRGKTRYDYPDRYEGETHHDFEPLLKSYIEYGHIPDSPIQLNPDWDFIEADLSATLDSAKSYNRQRRINVLENLKYDRGR